MKAFLTLSALLAITACTDPHLFRLGGTLAVTPVTLTAPQVARIKATVANDLYDGDAALFRNIRAADVTTSKDVVVRRVCGEVAGRNPVGGYGRYAAFGGTMINGVYYDEDYPRPCEK